MIVAIVLIVNVLLIVGGILAFNIYFRKEIYKDTTPPTKIDEAYRYAEKLRSDDDDFGSLFHARGDKVT